MRYKLKLTLVIFIILTGLVSCKSKTQKETINKQSQISVITEQEMVAPEKKDLMTDPPTSLSDLRYRLNGTIWVLGHDYDEAFYPKLEFKDGKVYKYIKWPDGNWQFNDSYSYTITEESDCFEIDFGDGRDDDHLKTMMWIYKDGRKARHFCNHEVATIHLVSY